MDDSIDSIAHAGLIFLIYLFVMVSLFFLLSGPVDAIMTAFSDSAVGTSFETEMNQFHGDFVLAIKIAFALGVAAPVTWLVMWVFSQEAGHYQYKRRF